STADKSKYVNKFSHVFIANINSHKRFNTTL
ncbi:MAG: hypothetical protein ACI9VO_000891, partial [Colwellia sp.]